MNRATHSTPTPTLPFPKGERGRIRPGTHQRGLALITAMLVLAISITTVTYMVFNQEIWMHQAQNMIDRSHVDSATYTGLQWALTTLTEDAKKNTYDHEADDIWGKWPEIDKDNSDFGIEGIVFGGKIADGQAKFNLNNLAVKPIPPVPGNPLPPAPIDYGKILKQILKNAGQEPNLAHALQDWVDSDPDVRSEGGAEDIDYFNVSPPRLPYRAANQALASFEELRLVRGFDAEVIDAIKDLVTVLPTSDPLPVNVNTASKDVLLALFDPLPAKDIEDLIDGRPYKDIGTVDAKLGKLLEKLPPLVTPKPTRMELLKGTYSVSSNYFEVRVDVEYGRTLRSAQALIYRPLASSATPGPSQIRWLTRQIAVKSTPAATGSGPGDPGDPGDPSAGKIDPENKNVKDPEEEQ